MSDTMSDIGRLREIVGVLARHGFGQWLERVNLGRFLPGRSPTPADQSEEASAKRLVEAFQELGPTFIKFGQILSSRPDVLPVAYIKALATLQDRVTPFTFAEVKKRIEDEFGQPLNQVYQSFEEAPIASASIGQVHRAITHDGRTVAVKIKRPAIDEQIQADVSLLYRVARLIESVIDLNIGYTPTEVVGDFERAIRMELDFHIEASNARRFAANFREKPFIRFPEVIESLSGQTVLTMEFIVAQKITATFDWPREKRKLIVDRLLDGGVQMVFEDGFYHGDPHPGNIFVDDECNIIFLDVGLAGTVPKYIMDGLLQLVVSAAMRDSATVARQIYKLGEVDERVNLNELKNDIDVILEQYLSQPWGSISAAELLNVLMARGAKFGIKLPGEVSGLAKAILNLEGTVRSLYPELDLLEVAKPYAAQYFNESFTFDALKPELIRRANEIVGMLQDMPLQISQLLMDLEKGRVNVVVKSPDVLSVNASIRSLAVTVGLSIIAGALLLGGITALASSMVVPSLVVGIIALVLGAVTGGFAALWHFVAIRMRRPRLTDFMPKR
jgi:ubiquinone biosynthesis protein